MKAFKSINAGKPYDQQVKPFNFIISCHVRKLGHPIGADPERFHLIAPYETDPQKWETVRWIDQYSDTRYQISASAPQPSRTMARLKSYADVLREYEYHPESKCAGANGKACRKQTAGLLGRRHVTMNGFTYIGKESNSLEEVEAETTTDAADVYTEYPDRRHDEWINEVLPFLRVTSARRITESTGISRRTVQRIRNEQTKPRTTHRLLLEAFARGERSKPHRGLLLSKRNR